MLMRFLSFIGINLYDDDDNRRSTPRRSVDNCVGMVDGQPFPIENWSDGGVLMVGNDPTIGIADAKSVILKFKLSERILSVQHRGKVVRKSNHKFAIQFDPLTREIANKFQQVVDDYVVQEFANSQSA